MTPTTTTKRVLKGDHNQCPACNQYFNSSAAFEKHRTGSHAEGSRKCLTPPEMRTLGMSTNSGDWWVTRLRETLDV